MFRASRKRTKGEVAVFPTNSSTVTPPMDFLGWGGWTSSCALTRCLLWEAPPWWEGSCPEMSLQAPSSSNVHLYPHCKLEGYDFLAEPFLICLRHEFFWASSPSILKYFPGPCLWRRWSNSLFWFLKWRGYLWLTFLVACSISSSFYLLKPPNFFSERKLTTSDSESRGFIQRRPHQRKPVIKVSRRDV